ncbi:MAG TPA: energy transducer TonB [Sphingomicrobium sp.]|nr:energy transducer TonB [Sphingomicrobium sp.]
MITLAIAITASMSFATQGADPTQSVNLSKNGEFIAKHYPGRALKAGEQGKVSFQIVVQPDGSLESCEITKSSGYKSLDDETCELILRYARLTPVRNAEGRAIRAVQNGYINWVHPRGRGKRASALAVAPVQTPDKIMCKRTPTTGSLIKRTKQCMTARQWGEAERIARNKAYAIIGQGYHEDGDGCEGVAGC